jgi:uncharacterized protein involved in type VI secretion and phage assembly
VRKVEGVVTGIVKEIDAERARLKLEFPWLEASYRSEWAPVAAPMSGNKRGIFMMPEKDDEVLVAFDHGCIDRPYVVGFLWNGVDQPPENTNKNRTIKTPGGHQLRFEDGGAKKIVVESNGGLTIVLDDGGDFIELHGGGRKMTMRNGQVQIT